MPRRVIAVSSGVLALCAAAVACAQALVIVDEDKLGRYWRAPDPGVLAMDVGSGREEAYGCVAIGFMIDRDGKMTAVRPLRRAFAKQVPPRRARELMLAVKNASPMLATYMPAPENPKRTEVFTALTIPVIGRKHGAGLSLAQREAVAAQLRPSCEISDLAAWVDSRDMRKEPEVEVAPEIDFAKIRQAD
jgi:hypothetical protein